MERQVRTGYGDLKGLVRERRGSGASLRPDEPRERDGVLAGAAWMGLITCVLFLAPLFNGLLGGWVGGRRTGSLPRALTAGAGASLVVALGLWVMLGPLGWPLLGLYGGLGTFLAIVLSVLGLLLGAAAGGLLTQVRTHRRRGA